MAEPFLFFRIPPWGDQYLSSPSVDLSHDVYSRHRDCWHWGVDHRGKRLNTACVSGKSLMLPIRQWPNFAHKIIGSHPAISHAGKQDR